MRGPGPIMLTCILMRGPGPIMLTCILMIAATMTNYAHYAILWFWNEEVDQLCSLVFL